MKEVEETIINKLKSKHRITLHKASFSYGSIPRYLILDRTRNIHSYIDFYNKDQKIILSEKVESLTELTLKLDDLCRIQYSTLDRPLFLLVHGDESHFYALEIAEVRENILSGDFTIENIENYSIDPKELFEKIRQEL